MRQKVRRPREGEEDRQHERELARKGQNEKKKWWREDGEMRARIEMTISVLLRVRIQAGSLRGQQCYLNTKRQDD